MVRAWRLVRAGLVDSAFDGEGARRFGGRWNPPGVPVVYLAESLALAALEVFVHLDRAAVSIPFKAIPVDLPARVIGEIARKELPPDWRALPTPESTQQAGAGWISAMRSAVLKVPSVLVPVEHNFVLNPRHKDFEKVTIGEAIDFSFDPRMWK